jgi:hypothetical protein
MVRPNLIAEAIRYGLNHWDGLTRFLVGASPPTTKIRPSSTAAAMPLRAVGIGASCVGRDCGPNESSFNRFYGHSGGFRRR